MSAPTKIIDAHQHVFWHGRDDAGLVANLDEHAIAQAILLTWEVGRLEGDVGFDGTFNAVHADPDRPHPGMPLADVMLTCRRYPGRFIPGYCPHPAGAYPLQRLESAVKMHGVRVCGEWKFRLTLDDPRCIELFRFCGQRGLPVVFHIDVPWLADPQTGQKKYCREWYGGTVENLAVALRECRDTSLIGHGPGFWREISGDADASPEGYPPGPVTDGGRLAGLLDRFGNLHADLSGFSGLNALQRDPPRGRDFLLRYHRRLLFGRDDYDGKLHAFLQTLDLPEDVTENVYHRNVEALLERRT